MKNDDVVLNFFPCLPDYTQASKKGSAALNYSLPPNPNRKKQTLLWTWTISCGFL